MSGRTLSGQTVEAFWNSVPHASPLIVGVNCSLGGKEIRPHITELALADTFGLPSQRGLAQRLRRLRRDAGGDRAPLHEFADRGMVNVVGGCCGTTPAHIAAIAEAVAGHAAAPFPAARAGRRRGCPGWSRSTITATPGS